MTEERRRSVENGTWRAASVSQLKSLHACGLKWWYDKVAHHPRKPETKNQRIGIQGHAEIEHYLKTGQDVRGKFARAGNRYLPAPGPGLLVEYRFDGRPKDAPFEGSVLQAGGIPLDGFIDIVNLRYRDTAGPLPGADSVVPVGTVLLTDHKFSSDINPPDLGGYAATEEDLIDTGTEAGIQMMGYAEWARLTYPRARQIAVQHIYYSNKSPRARSVYALVDLAHVEKAWFKVNALAAVGVNAAKQTDPLRVPFNVASCDQYRGCDYAGVCPRSPINSWINEESDMSLMSSIDDLLPGDPDARKPIPAAEAENGQDYFIPNEGMAGKANGSGPNGTQFITPVGATLVRPDAEVIPVVQGEPPPVTEAPPKKTRASKKVAAPVMAEEPPAVIVPDAPPPLRLYVGCRPDAGSIRLDDYIADAVSRMAAKFETKDVRIAPDRNSPIAFGGWKGILAAFVRASPPSPGSYHVTPGGDFADIVIESLASFLPAENVVRAT